MLVSSHVWLYIFLKTLLWDIFSYSPHFSKEVASLMVQTVKNQPALAGDMGSIPRSGRSLEKGNGNLLQYSCLGSPLDRGAWQATVHGVAKSETWLRMKQQQQKFFDYRKAAAFSLHDLPWIPRAGSNSYGGDTETKEEQSRSNSAILKSSNMYIITVK